MYLQIQEQELEAAASLLECVPQQLCFSTVGVDCCSADKPSTAVEGFYLQVPLDASTVSSLESCLKASFAADCMQRGAPKLSPSSSSNLFLHILSPPGSLYPFDPPVAWVGVGGGSQRGAPPGGAPSGAPMEEEVSPFGAAVGAMLCGAFAAHNAVRLSRPLQQLRGGVAGGEGEGPLGGPPLSGPPPVSKLLSVLSSSACETTVSEIDALLHAAWQLEAHFDDLLSKESEGPRGMHARWVAAATTGAPYLPPASGAAAGVQYAAQAAAAAAGAAAAKREAPERQQQQETPNQQQARDSRGSPRSPAAAGAPRVSGAKAEEGPSSSSSSSRSLSGPLPSISSTRNVISEKETEVCRNIINSINHSASADALGLPVRQHYDAVLQFLADPHKRVLVLQGETG